MKNDFILLALCSFFLISNLPASTHFYDEPYECTSVNTSKRTGKEFMSLHYYHPKKNLYLVLRTVKKAGSFKVANLFTPEGRYDGIHKSIYPNIKGIKMMTYWPYKEKRAVKLSSKIKKSDCSLLKNKTVFDMPYLNTLECMDPKGLGTCKALNR